MTHSDHMFALHNTIRFPRPVPAAGPAAGMLEIEILSNPERFESFELVHENSSNSSTNESKDKYEHGDNSNFFVDIISIWKSWANKRSFFGSGQAGLTIGPWWSLNVPDLSLYYTILYHIGRSGYQLRK